MKVQELFNLGMKRELPDLLDFPSGGLILNLGCGKHVLDGCVNLDYPKWDAETYHITLPRRILDPDHPALRSETMDYAAKEAIGELMLSCPSGIIAGIHAYHFLEHLHDPRRMLREMQRVLMPGGVLNICVPHYWGSMAHHDLDHKHNFAVDTWSNTFAAPWYDKDREGWELNIHFNALMAVTERNAAIITQLVKRAIK